MSNRTTLIDSRSPISEEQRLHRATVALALVSEEAASAKIGTWYSFGRGSNRLECSNPVKHLADYVVTWVNGNGEDLAKLGVIASVANEAYLFVCGADVNCKLFESPEGKGRVFNSKVKSTLLYKLGRYRSRGNEDITLSHFEHMYTSAHGKVSTTQHHSVSLTLLGASIQGEQSIQQVTQVGEKTQKLHRILLPGKTPSASPQTPKRPCEITFSQITCFPHHSKYPRMCISPSSCS